MNKYVEIINMARKEAMLTWAELSRRSGVNASTLNGWVHGVVKPNVDDVAKALKGLGLELCVCIRTVRGDKHDENN